MLSFLSGNSGSVVIASFMYLTFAIIFSFVALHYFQVVQKLKSKH